MKRSSRTLQEFLESKATSFEDVILSKVSTVTQSTLSGDVIVTHRELRAMFGREMSEETVAEQQ